MPSLNKVVIMGNLGQDPELKYTQSQTPVVTLSVATTDYRSVDGQRQEQTEWHRVVVWGKQAENCSKYLQKGRAVLVEGRLQTRSWEDKNGGGKRYATEIVAQNVQFLGGGPRQDNSSSYGAPTAGFSGEQSTAASPNNGGDASAATDYSFGGSSEQTPSLDEIPF